MGLPPSGRSGVQEAAEGMTPPRQFGKALVEPAGAGSEWAASSFTSRRGTGWRGPGRSRRRGRDPARRPSCRSGTAATVKAMLPESVRARPGGRDPRQHLSPDAAAMEWARLGGLHRFMNWQRPILTDPGGFRDEPRRVAQTDRGGRHVPQPRGRLDPPSEPGKQHGDPALLGSDIVMASTNARPCRRRRRRSRPRCGSRCAGAALARGVRRPAGTCPVRGSCKAGSRGSCARRARRR